MYTSQEAKECLKGIEWQEGKIIPVAEGPYRYRIVVQCSSVGRQKAIFTNGEYPYFSYIESVDGQGQWVKQGTGLVPVLPDGRLIMVVEQRAAQGRFPDRPMIAQIGGKKVDLKVFGLFSSLEFPGGAVDGKEGLKAGFIRELQEETGAENQSALFYKRRWPTYSLGSDEARQQFLGVVFLSGFSFASHVKTDGGLTILALTPYEVQTNIWSGVIHSGQAALAEWGFYKEVEIVRQHPSLEKAQIRLGYLEIEQIKLVKS